MSFGLPKGMRLLHDGQLLKLLRVDGWALDIVDEAGEPVTVPLGSGGMRVRPDIDWLLAESREGRLTDADDPHAIIGGARGRFLGLDRDACAARDGKSLWKHEWAMAAINAGIARSEAGANAFLKTEPAPASGDRPKWRALLRWVATLLEDPHLRVGNLVSTAGREKGQSQLTERMDLIVQNMAALYWSEEGDPFKTDTAARIVGIWDELKAAGATNIGIAPPTLECVRERINSLQNRISYAARNGEHAAERYYGANGEPVGAEHVMERVTLDGVVFKHVCTFAHDWKLPAARMKGVFAMDWKSSFVFDGPVFTGPFRPEATERALLGLMIGPRLTAEQIAKDPRRLDCHGVPSQLHPDNEKALLPPSMVPGLVNIISYLEMPKAYHSDAKAKHERFHRFLHGAVKRLSGRILGPGPSRDPRYNPLDNPDVTMAQFAHIIQAARLAWNERSKKWLGNRSPMDVLLEGLAQRKARGMPTEEIERHLSRTVEVVLTTNGVEFDNLRYRFNERGIDEILDANVRRMPFEDRLRDTGRCTLTARVWDSDVDYIELYDPEHRKYHRLYSTDPDYSAGLTRFEHQEFHRMLRAGKGGGTKPMDKLRKRNELLKEIEDTLPQRAFRARAAGVALLQHEQMRRAAGKLGRSPAYDVLLAQVLPTEPSGAERKDDPKAPPQTRNMHRGSRDDDQEAQEDEQTTQDDEYPVADRGAGIEAGDDEGRPSSIWDDDRNDEEDE
ncbi:hypothetical protein [uncultured Sphingomonas sp.]|uniref:hypothetical protein n=1 Tax=uncultured Sphingomonas sp. TaxID=158754 RepID=UPI0025FCE84C|nr:hypothetical protein [uncultured Sphingomonas sp.]